MHRAPIVTGILASTLAVLVLGCGGGDGEVADTGVAANDCPEANAAFKKAGVRVPEEYAPACPTPAQIRAAIKLSGFGTPTPPAALRDAVEKGVIHEDQDPRTYPPEVKQAIRQWEAENKRRGQ